MKSNEELNTIKEEVETVNRKLHELTEEELKQVCGGAGYGSEFQCPEHWVELQWDHNDWSGKFGYFTCPICGQWTYDRVNHNYKKGWIEN